MTKTNIALLYGGISGEREVSINTGKMIFDALDKEKYNILKYDPKIDLRSFLLDALDKKIDMVFPALHGPYGEDGKLQGMLDMLGLKYVFSGTLASALAMDKNITKILASNIGITIAPDIVIKKGSTYEIEEIIRRLNLPLVIKPVELGSSVGTSIAKNADELNKGITDAFQHSDRVLIEAFIKGRELTATVMEIDGEVKALPVIEIIPKTSSWFDYRAKYEVGASEEICPAKIPNDITKIIQQQSVDIFNMIGCKDLARADFILEEGTGNLIFLEINTIPGMTATSLAPQAAKSVGMEFSEFLDKLIENALK